MIYIGIDVAKDKHDCFGISSDGEIVIDNVTIQNNRQGFLHLLDLISSLNVDFSQIRVGLEATGHYSNNICNFITSHGLSLCVINPLLTTQFRKSKSLRNTKTDKLDAKYIATLLITNNFRSYSTKEYHISELKSLERHRFRLVEELSKLKISYSRLVNILFPELEKNVNSISCISILKLLFEFPTVDKISNCNLTRLTNLLKNVSRNSWGKSKAIEIRQLARNSIGTVSVAKALELKQVISSILHFQEQLSEADNAIKEIIDDLNTPLMSIPGISYTLAAIIIAEIGNIEFFDSPAKLQAFAGIDPSTYQSGKFIANSTKMVKHGSKYLRYAIFHASRLVANNVSTFINFKNKKISEGKHFFVVLSHIGKKFIRLIFSMLKENAEFNIDKCF